MLAQTCAGRQRDRRQSAEIMTTAYNGIAEMSVQNDRTDIRYSLRNGVASAQKKKTETIQLSGAEIKKHCANKRIEPSKRTAAHSSRVRHKIMKTTQQKE